MLNFQESLIVSPHLSLYDQFIPKDHLLRQMNDVIDVSFVQEELASKSDVIDSSTLTKFRK